MRKYIFENEMKTRRGEGQIKTVAVQASMVANSHTGLLKFKCN